MNRFRKVAAAAAAALAVAAGGGAALAPAASAATAPKLVPHVVVFGDDGTFTTSSGLALAAVGQPPHVGSSDGLNCRVVVAPAVNPQTSFVPVNLGGGRFALQWANGDDRALSQHLYVSLVGGRSQFAGFSHTIGAAETLHESGGQVVSDTGLALNLLPGHGAGAVPAGGSQPGTFLNWTGC